MHAETSATKALPPLPLESVEAIDAAVFRFFQSVRSLQRLALGQAERLQTLRSRSDADPAEIRALQANLRRHQAAARALMQQLGDD